MHNPNEQLKPMSPIERYNAATDLLVQRVHDIQASLKFTPKYDMGDMVIKFREGFKNPSLRKMVLIDKYEDWRIETANFSSGFCGIASYSWAHIFRMPDGTPMWRIYKYYNQNDIYGLKSHVWLQSAIDNTILDLTFDQSLDADGVYWEIPYYLGVRASEHFAFQRAFKFGDFIDMDLRKMALQNTLTAQRTLSQND